MRDPESYQARQQVSSEIEYVSLEVLRVPLLIDAVKYYEENIRAPIIIVNSEGNMGYKKIRTPRYHSQGFRYNVLPLKLQSRRLLGVPIQKLDDWSSGIEERNATLGSHPEIPFPRFENSELPMVDAWIGVLGYDRQTVIADILQATMELTILHWYDVENGKEIFKPEVKRSHLIATFSPRPCWD